MKRDHGKKACRCHARLRPAGDEKGAALMLVLILTATSLALTAGLIYLVTSAAQMTGGEKRFEKALDSGKSGIEVVRAVVATRGDLTDPGTDIASLTASLDNFSAPATSVAGFDCLTDKVENATADWNPRCQSSLTITPGTTASYDISFNLGTGGTDTKRVSVYAKIIDTVAGNSGPASNLINTGVVNNNPGVINPVEVPFLYTVELIGEKAVNPLERSRVSVLYQY